MRTRSIIVMAHNFHIVFGLVNLSVNKSADMSTSQYSDKWLADEAVDGDVSQDVQDNSCAVTLYGYTPEAWWRVDLGDVFVINNVRIYNRKESPSVTYRLSGFSLYVSDTSNWQNGVLCHQDNNGVQYHPYPSDVHTIPCNATGRYVTLYKQRKSSCMTPNQPQYCVQLELCEVQVFGCENSTYGTSCESDCSGNCLSGQTCNKAHGGCDNGCGAGYYGFRCDKVCSAGFFGMNCSSPCDNCFNSSCNNLDGSCSHGCFAGWKGSYCNESCDEGEYGPGCLEKCSENCFGGTCDSIYGACHFGCNDGWTGNLCNEVCHPGFYGANCSTACSTCSEFCHHQTGECLVVWRDTQTSSKDGNTVIILLIVTNVLTVIALVTSVSLLCRHIRTSPNTSSALQTQQDSSHGAPHLHGNRHLGSTRGRELSYQPGTGNGSTENCQENRTYEGLQMNITDTNTYEMLQRERNVTYTNTQLI